MIDQCLSDADEQRASRRELSRCDMLDEYWESLQAGSVARPARHGIDPCSPDPGIAWDLAALNLLHDLRHSYSDGGRSAAQTLRLSPDCNSPPPRNEGPLDQSERKEAGAGQAPERGGGLLVADPPASNECPLPGQIGKYVVLDLLDAGGQGQVFRVLHRKLGKEYVLKLARRPIAVEPPTADDPGTHSSLHREGKLLAALDHPNLVKVVDLDIHEGRLFVVMEHVHGLTLDQFADQQRPSPRRAADLVAELARAATYLHDRGVVHQDIKPRNVLIDESGRPRLIDFGLARQRHAWSCDGENPVGGTAEYMSPEQALGRSDRLGPWTDIFGLGGLLYHLLTRRPLYQGATWISSRWQAMKADYVPVRQVNPAAPRALERICRKALSADPSSRFRTARDLELSLRRYLAGRRFAWAGLGVLAILAALLLAVARELSDASDGRPTGALPSAQPAMPAPPRPTIESLRVDHYALRNGSWQSVPLGLSTTVCEGDEATVAAILDAPAYGYLLALNPDGKVQLCQPREETELPRLAREIHFGDNTYFPFSDGPGLQVFIVLASRQPLPPYDRWAGRAWLEQNWKPVAVDSSTGIWRHDGQVATLFSSVPRGPLRNGPAPPASFNQLCRYLATLPETESMQAIAFPVNPKE
jgi:serine/threonine protein kinase